MSGTGQHQGHASQRGFTLVEAAIVSVVLSVLSIMIVQSIRGLATTQVYTRGQARTLDLAERLVQDIAHDVRYAVRVFTESAEDRAFLAYFDLKGAEILRGSRLPVVSANGVFEQDPSNKVYTGNLLVMGVSAPHALASLGRPGSDDKVRIDVFRFLIYHLIEGEGDLIDIARWSSVQLASYADLLGIADASERRSAVQSLEAQGITMAWDVGAQADQSFFSFSKIGELSPITNSNGDPVKPDEEDSVRQLLQSRQAQIARNGSSRKFDVPLFANASELYPHGFEIKLDGGGAGRLMMIRLVVNSAVGGSVRNTSAVARVVSVRDL